MCLPQPKAPRPQVTAQSAPVTASTPEFETEMADIDTQSGVKMKKKKGKDQLKISKDPAIAMPGSGTGGSSSSGVNIT